MKTILNLLFAIAAFASFAAGADTVFKIGRADVACKLIDGAPQADTLQFVFDKSLNEEELVPCGNDPECKTKQTAMKKYIEETLRNPENYYLIQITSGTKLDVRNIKTQGILDNTINFELSADYKLAEDYMLIARSTSTNGKVPLMIKIEATSSCDAKPTDLAAFKKREDEEKQPDKKISDYVNKAANKESPILKVDFSLQGAKHQQSIYNINVKFKPYTTRHLGLGGHYEVTYFFFDTEYKINAKKGDKKNVLNVGVLETNYTKVFRDDGDERTNRFYERFPGIAFTLTPKMETEWRFKEMNLLLSPKVTVPINIYQSRYTTVQINPFGGLDLGVNARSKVAKPSWQVIRPFFGAGITGNFFRKDDKPRVVYQLDYIRRVFARPELSYGFDSDGKEIPDSSTKTPRDHFKSRITFNMKEFFAPFIEYEYGWVPPKYSLLNSSFKTGVIFDVDLMWKTFLK